jgi:hypothetical protein
MGDELRLGKDSEGSDGGVMEVLSWNLSGGPEKHHENPVSIVCVPASIWNDHLMNTSLEPYRDTNLCYLTTLFQLKMLHNVDY